MRLKGGKVLLDLTGLGDLITQDYTSKNYPISVEEYKIFAEKGLRIKILFNGDIIYSDLIVTKYDSADTSYEFNSILEWANEEYSVGFMMYPERIVINKIANE